MNLLRINRDITGRLWSALLLYVGREDDKGQFTHNMFTHAIAANGYNKLTIVNSNPYITTNTDSNPNLHIQIYKSSKHLLIKHHKTTKATRILPKWAAGKWTRIDFKARLHQTPKHAILYKAFEKTFIVYLKINEPLQFLKQINTRTRWRFNDQVIIFSLIVHLRHKVWACLTNENDLMAEM